jgi:hypothetical protein
MPCVSIASKVNCPFPWAEREDRIPFLRQIVSGRFWEESQRAGQFPIRQSVILCDFLPAFIPKGRVGRHSRAISRNGLILLMNSLASEPISGLSAELRLGFWNRSILPDSAPEPYGILMILRPFAAERAALPSDCCVTTFSGTVPSNAVLSLDLGGNKFLSILRQEFPL